jgi:hypothetical protein
MSGAMPADGGCRAHFSDVNVGNDVMPWLSFSDDTVSGRQGCRSGVSVDFRESRGNGTVG